MRLPFGIVFMHVAGTNIRNIETIFKNLKNLFFNTNTHN
ncbi:hypothetical protein B602_0614 [Chlamydia psittaci M56]|nr:hypothetical protein B602_0614 [Chlamydia psittaci M56]